LRNRAFHPLLPCTIKFGDIRVGSFLENERELFIKAFKNLRHGSGGDE